MDRGLSLGLLSVVGRSVTLVVTGIGAGIGCLIGCAVGLLGIHRLLRVCRLLILGVLAGVGIWLTGLGILARGVLGILGPGLLRRQAGSKERERERGQGNKTSMPSGAREARIELGSHVPSQSAK